MGYKKILIFIPTLHSGGAERVVSILANNWVIQGHKIIICLLDSSKINFRLDPRIKIVRIYGVSSLKKNSVKCILEFRKIINYYKPNIIQSFLTEYNLIALLASLGLNIPVFVSDRANPFTYRGFMIETLRKVLYSYATGIIAQTNTSKQVIYTKTKHNNIRVIPNPVELPKLTMSKTREKIILNVGRLVAEKGQVDLIKIFYKSELYNFGWKLSIIGEGPERANLEIMIQSLGLENHVDLKGEIKNVAPFLNESSLFAFTSHSEGFPNSLLEAMSYGLAVISYDCEVGPKDIITNNYNGILINGRDENKYVQELINLATNSRLRKELSQNAISSSKNYSADLISKCWFNFINT